MRATIMDLRRNPGKIVEALERNETVTLSKRGREIAHIVPNKKAKSPISVTASPAFGMWKDRQNMDNPTEYVRQRRKGRFSDL